MAGYPFAALTITFELFSELSIFHSGFFSIIGKHKEFHKCWNVGDFVRNFGGEVHPNNQILMKQSLDNLGLVCTKFGKFQKHSNAGVTNLALVSHSPDWLQRGFLERLQSPVRVKGIAAGSLRWSTWTTSLKLFLPSLVSSEYWVKFSMYLSGTLQDYHTCDALCLNLSWKISFFLDRYLFLRCNLIPQMESWVSVTHNKWSPNSWYAF